MSQAPGERMTATEIRQGEAEFMARWRKMVESQPYWFDIVLKNPSRALTRKQWRDIRHYLRIVRRRVHTRINPLAIYRATIDLVCFGTSIVFLPNTLDERYGRASEWNPRNNSHEESPR